MRKMKISKTTASILSEVKLDSGAIILISNRMINEFRLENLAIFTLLT